MKPLRPLPAVAAAVAAGAVIALAVLARGDAEIEPIVQTAPRMTIEASVTPQSHLFADGVVAELELLFDRRVVVPESLRVSTAFEPYQAAPGALRERSDAGDLVRLRYVWPLECVSEECAPRTGGETQFRLSRVDYGLRGGGRSAVIVEWAPVRMRTRLAASDLASARWRADLQALPEASYRLSPGLLAAGLLTVAGLLVLGAVFLALRLLPGRGRQAGTPEDERERTTPVERALALACEASANGSGADGRKALERLAQELGDAGLDQLAGRARRLAWSSAPPMSEAVDELAGDVRAALGESE